MAYSKAAMATANAILIPFQLYIHESMVEEPNKKDSQRVKTSLATCLQLQWKVLVFITSFQ